MSDKGVAERLQPSLLDRLTDEEPDQLGESRDRRVIDLKRLREIVRRDLTWLFNTTALESVQSLDAYPNTRRSTANYGVPDIAGIEATQDKALELRRRLIERVRYFEPRILADSLQISIVDSDLVAGTVIAFDISGELWAQPLPIELYMRTELDVTSGSLTIRAQS